MDIASIVGIIGLWALMACMVIGLKKLEQPAAKRP